MMRPLPLLLLLSITASLVPLSLASAGSPPRLPLMISYHALEQPAWWEHDLGIIRDLGFNVIRLFYVGLGADYELLDRFLGLCDREGVQVIVTLHQRPTAPVGERVFAVSQRGTVYDWAPRIESSRYRELWAKHVRRVAEICRRHPCVIAYNLFNEPHYPENEHYDNDLCDYSPEMVSAFRAWLRARYGDVRRLNLAWGTSYASFDEVEPPRTPSPRWWEWPSDPGWLTAFHDWRRFHAERLSAFVAESVRLLRSLDPSRPVIINEMPWFVWPQGGYAALDPRAIFGEADIIGIDIYPAEDDARWLAFTAVLLRHYFPGKGLYLFEVNHKAGSPTSGMIARWLFEASLFGCEGLGWFELDAMPKLDGGDYGLLGPDKELRRYAAWLKAALEAVRTLGPSLRELGETIVGSAEAAVVYGEANAFMCAGDWLSAFSMLSAFWEPIRMGFPMDVLPESALSMANMSRYKVILLAGQHFLTMKALAALKRWVREGGVLIADAGTALYAIADNGTVIKGDSLVLRLLGLRSREILMWSHGFPPKGSGATIEAEGELLPSGGIVERLSPLDGTRIVARFSDGSPAIIRMKLGRGEVIYIATSLAWLARDEGWRRFFASLLCSLGLERDPRLLGAWELEERVAALVLRWDSMDELHRSAALEALRRACSHLVAGEHNEFVLELLEADAVISGAEKSIRELESRLLESEQEIRELREQLSRMRALLRQANATIGELRAQNESLLAKVRELEKSLEEARARAQQLERELAQLREERARLLSELEAARQRLMIALSATISTAALLGCLMIARRARTRER